MENLIRIKLDPHRGGAESIDFLRPCFVLSDWPFDAIEIWRSNDGGLAWEKLDDDEFTACFNASELKLYVSLLFDITSTTVLAFFSPVGSLVPMGWDIEGPTAYPAGVGWTVGADNPPVVPVGFTLEGESGANTPLGYMLKWPTVRNTPVGCAYATPADTPCGLGCTIGTVYAQSVGLGTTIFGLGEFGLDFLVLDSPALSSLAAEAAHRKQKMVTLTGTDPEELD
jgi:hypothetical protein